MNCRWTDFKHLVCNKSFQLHTHLPTLTLPRSSLLICKKIKLNQVGISFPSSINVYRKECSLLGNHQKDISTSFSCGRLSACVPTTLCLEAKKMRDWSNGLWECIGN